MLAILKKFLAERQVLRITLEFLLAIAATLVYLKTRNLWIAILLLTMALLIEIRLGKFVVGIWRKLNPQKGLRSTINSGSKFAPTFTSRHSSAANPTEIASLGTQLQSAIAFLRHEPTQTLVEIPTGIQEVRIGKRAGENIPEIDVSGFAHSDVASREHCCIFVEGNAFFIEDARSSNGTYINQLRLPRGQRLRLKYGDCISLGKDNLLAFTFEIERPSRET